MSEAVIPPSLVVRTEIAVGFPTIFMLESSVMFAWFMTDEAVVYDSTKASMKLL